MVLTNIFGIITSIKEKIIVFKLKRDFKKKLVVRSQIENKMPQKFVRYKVEREHVKNMEFCKDWMFQRNWLKYISIDL